MNKDIVISATYKTIKDSLEWGIGTAGKEYSYFVNGIITQTDALLKILDTPKDPENCENKEY